MEKVSAGQRFLQLDLTGYPAGIYYLTVLDRPLQKAGEKDRKKLRQKKWSRISVIEFGTILVSNRKKILFT